MTKQDLKLNPYKALAEANQELLDEGVPVELVAHMSALAEGRLRWMQLKARIAREILPIQQLPEPPPGVFFYDWPVTEGDDDEE